MKGIYTLCVLLPLICFLTGCKSLGNATLIACDSGGIIEDSKNQGDVAELQLGVPSRPLMYSKLEITIDGITYPWNIAIKQKRVRVDTVSGWPCSLGGRSFGHWEEVKGIKGYYFHDLHAHLYVSGNKLYSIKLHNPPKDWTDANTIILDGKDLKDLSVEEAKKLFDDGVKFESSKFLWRMG